MPGTIVFKPIEANLTHNTDFIKKMNPYCAFIIGNKRINSQICKHGGKHPHWNDAVTVPFTNESRIMVELMDKDKITKDDHIGSFMIDLPELETQGQSSKWYPLFYKNKPAGEILLEASFQGQPGFGGQQAGFAGQQTGFVGQQAGFAGQEAGFIGQETGFNQGLAREENFGQTGFVQREEAFIQEPAFIQQETLVNQKPIVEEGTRTFVEQRQHVEPHTFLKEVDVVETRPVQQTIEVMEPRKVLKEVQYTEAVPVKKQIETIEPQVIRKEVEVMEPKLVTKTIQVVENVPVKKQVEVIESVPRIQEVETFEPQTFTKQVEVTEQVPVMKQVTVTEPVHLKKAVEFVEPIITTETITKEIRPEVIVNEEITTSVGPATYIGEVRELSQRFSQISLTEQERTRYLGMTEQDRLKLNDEERWRWHEARRVSGGGYNYGSNFGVVDPNQFGQFNLSENERLRYMNMSEKERLALKGDDLLRWQEAQRFSGSGFNYGGNQSNRFNLSEDERLRYMNLSEKDRLKLKGEELLRWEEAKRLSHKHHF